MTGDFTPMQLREVARPRETTMFAQLIKTFFGTTASSNGTKLDGGFFASHRILALLSVPVFIALNNKLALGITEEQFKWYTGAVLAFVIGKTAEDATKRSAAIKADAEPAPAPALTIVPEPPKVS